MHLRGDEASIYRQDRLGQELACYRRRSEKDILRGIGQGALYYMSPLFLLIGAVFLCLPLILLLPKPADGSALLEDPLWRSVIIGWFALCVAALAWLMYFLPRRGRLVIHQNGFVYRSLYRTRIVLFEDIASCEARQRLWSLMLQMKDGQKKVMRGLLLQFPAEGIVLLLETMGEKLTSGPATEQRTS